MICWAFVRRYHTNHSHCVRRHPLQLHSLSWVLSWRIIVNASLPHSVFAILRNQTINAGFTNSVAAIVAGLIIGLLTVSKRKHEIVGTVQCSEHGSAALHQESKKKKTLQ